LADLAGDEVLLNESLSEQLNASVGDELMLIMGRPTPVTVAGIVPDGELAGSGPALIWTLDQAQTFLTRPGEITDIFVSNAGNAETGVDATEAATTALTQILPDTLTLTAVKADQLDTAASSAEFITTLFVTFGTFSIFSGILLIFLIFSVLAAERKSELGMGRAVGLQRADLVRQFVSEGLAYNFLAALSALSWASSPRCSWPASSPIYSAAAP
jgi:putative ABC transport system permease protein